MTVQELRDMLDGLPGDRLVVLAKDAEGNRYSPLAEVGTDERYVAENTWSGDVLHPDDYDDYDDWVPAVCLGPVN